MNSQQGSKYSHINPVYQIDFQSTASGKRLSGTKRRVKFRFGFSNAEAIVQGAKGIECRGEEHEICLVWSLTSGKRLVVADGEEVHFSKGNRTEGRFETSWTIPGGHIIKLIAHAAPPVFVVPGFRQFDLLLDGRSYFEMPRIYELGMNVDRAQAQKVLQRKPAGQTHNNCITPTSTTIHAGYGREPSYSTPRSLVVDEPRDSFAWAPRVVSEQSLEHSGSVAVTDMLDSSAAMDMLDTTPAITAAVPTHDTFAPVAPAPQEHSFHTVTNQIMSAYAPPTGSPQYTEVPVLANEAHTHYVPVNPIQASQGYSNQQQQLATHLSHQSYYNQYAPAAVSPENSYSQMSVSPANTPVPTGEPVVASNLSMEPLNIHELEVRENPPVSELERAVMTLVNLGDISEQVESPEKFKMNQRKLENQPEKSRALPPAKANWTLGANASLGEIQRHAEAKSEPKKEIMRTHAFDPAAAQAGMMVVYGATPQGYHVQQQPQQYYPQQPMMYQQQVMPRAY